MTLSRFLKFPQQKCPTKISAALNPLRWSSVLCNGDFEGTKVQTLDETVDCTEMANNAF